MLRESASRTLADLLLRGAAAHPPTIVSMTYRCSRGYSIADVAAAASQTCSLSCSCGWAPACRAASGLAPPPSCRRRARSASPTRTSPAAHARRIGGHQPAARATRRSVAFAHDVQSATAHQRRGARLLRLGQADSPSTALNKRHKGRTSSVSGRRRGARAGRRRIRFIASSEGARRAALATYEGASKSGRRLRGRLAELARGPSRSAPRRLEAPSLQSATGAHHLADAALVQRGRPRCASKATAFDGVELGPRGYSPRRWCLSQALQRHVVARAPRAARAVTIARDGSAAPLARVESAGGHIAARRRAPRDDLHAVSVAVRVAACARATSLRRRGGAIRPPSPAAMTSS